MKYSEAVDFLDSKVVLGVKPSLDRIKAVCRMLEEPEAAYDSIQITGTNGKTSVSHMAAGILKASGFRVGLFTSPHLETVRERMTVNGKLVSASEFTDVLSELKPVIEKAEAEVDEALTYFEVVTAMALLYFRREQVDVAVLEVGMGGRWDSTNVVDCDVAVITNVDLDHVNELGDTREKIAREKAGIINEGCVLVTSEPDREILMLFAQRCEELGADMKVFGRDFRLEYTLAYRVRGETPAQIISVRGLEGREFNEIKLPLLGKHQAVNAACAIAACQAYTDRKERTDLESYRRALESSSVPGRLEVLATHPLVLTDGAHNILGMDRLAAALTGEFDYERLVIVVAILADKDARGMLKVLGSIADELILTENRSARCISAQRLGDFCRMDRQEHQVEPDFSKAMKLAYNSAGRRGQICVTGSLYTVSEARIFFRQQKASREMRQDR
ncbi:MAG TPA: folylpolyglutamate synthase/dihydrofolate synthase family protein [Candidatus Anoxymicrobiaceae bacterium]